MKICFRCKSEKEAKEFHKSKASTDGLFTWCKDCVSEYNKTPEQRERRLRVKRSAPNLVKANARHLKRMYGISLDEFESISSAQDGRCAVCCRLPDKKGWSGHRLVVDHDHRTGEVRGLLCRDCNAGMGFLGDDSRRLRALADYVDRPMFPMRKFGGV